MGCYAQQRDLTMTDIGHISFMSDKLDNSERVVLSYHVEERINMNFGGRITTYNVPDLSLVSTHELGPNNSRIITPKYGRAKSKSAVTITRIERPRPLAISEIPAVTLKPMKVEIADVEKRPKFVNINIIGTYERVLDKGYQSVDMLKRVGNSRFFHGDLVVAAKWYTRLFALTSDLEPEYYYRYAQALASISQTEEAQKMMAIFKNKQYFAAAPTNFLK